MATESTPTDDTTVRPTTGVDAIDYERYSVVETDDEYIIYDRDCQDAWIQSTVAVSVEAYR